MGVKYGDGLYLPTKKEPFTDGLTGATPHSGFDVKMQPAGGLKQFRIKIEINHSTDFNESYPKSAQEGDDNYSGGKEGSGQPAVVYAADIDLTSGVTSYVASLIGHSSPDGSSGQLYTDTSTPDFRFEDCRTNNHNDSAMKQYLFVMLFFLIPFFSKGQRECNPVRYQVTNRQYGYSDEYSFDSPFRIGRQGVVFSQ